MSDTVPWKIDDTGGGDVPWEVDDSVVQPAKKPLSAWEKVQQESTGFLSGLGQELPNVATRFGNLGSDVYHGWKEKLRDAGVLSSDTADVADEVRRAEREWKTRQAFEKASAPAANEGTGMSFGRMSARAAPQVAAGIASGGTSIPAQAAIGGSAGLLQSLSEDASPESVALQTGLGAAAPFAGEAMNAAGSFIKAPFKKWTDQAAMDAARNLGVELPASAVTTSPMVRNVETLSGKLIGGQGITNRATKAAEDLNAAGSRLAGPGASEGASTQAGLGLAEDYGAARGGLQAAKNAEYGRVGDLTGIPGVPQGTLDEIDRMLAQGTAAPDVLERLKALREAIAPKAAESAVDLGRYADDPNMAALIQKQLGAEAPAPTPRSVADLMSQQAGLEYGGPNALSDAALSNRLRESLGGDVNRILGEAAPDQLAQLGAAKTAYGKYADLSKSTLGRNVSRLDAAGQPDKIVESVVNPSASVQDLRRVMEVARPETVDQIRQNVLADIVGGARGAEVRLTPEKIAGAVKRWKPERLREILTTEQYGRLQDLMTTSRAMGRASKISEGSQTTPWLKTAQYLGAPQAIIAAILTGHPLAGAGMAGSIGVEAALAKAIGSKGGQKWLTTGFGPSTLGGKLARPVSGGSSRIVAEVELAKRRRALEQSMGGR